MNIPIVDKVIAGAILLIVGLVVVYIKGDIPINLLSLMQWIYCSFVAGASVQHVSNAMIANKNVDK